MYLDVKINRGKGPQPISWCDVKRAANSIYKVVIAHA